MTNNIGPGCTPHCTPNRRDFLRCTAAGAALLVGGAPAPAQTAQPPTTADRPKTFPLRLGLASYSLRKFSLAQTIAMTKRVDLKYLCLKSFHLPLEATAEQIAAAAKQVKEAGLELYAGGVITMRKPEEVQQAFAYAKAAGMKMIIASPAVEVLPLVEEHVKKHNIAVAIHNHGPGDKVYPTPESVMEKIKDLDRRIGLCIDVGHTLRIGADPIADARRFASRLLDLHIKDVTAADAKGRELEVGRGVINIPALLKTLIDIGFAGVVAFEYEKDPDDPLPGLAESVGYVRGVMATLIAAK
jgi:sugar phosphate isomerase/epimerase